MLPIPTTVVILGADKRLKAIKLTSEMTISTGSCLGHFSAQDFGNYLMTKRSLIF